MISSQVSPVEQDHLHTFCSENLPLLATFLKYHIHLSWIHALHEVHLIEFEPTPLLQTPHGSSPDFITGPAPTRHLITLVFFIFTISPISIVCRELKHSPVMQRVAGSNAAAYRDISAPQIERRVGCHPKKPTLGPKDPSSFRLIYV